MIQRVDGRYVHKVSPDNVLLAWITQRVEDPEWYDAELVIDATHPFFFEHPLDHIPAMMLVEAGRQMGIAIAHMYLGVPLGTMFATESFDIRFTEFAETDATVLIAGRVTDRTYRKGELLHLRLDGSFSQNGKQLGGMGGTWAMLRPELWARYRRRERMSQGA